MNAHISLDEHFVHGQDSREVTLFVNFTDPMRDAVYLRIGLPVTPRKLAEAFRSVAAKLDDIE